MPSPELRKEVSLLIVDDDDIDVMGLYRALEKLKVANPCFRAKDGLEALDMLRSGVVPAPSLVLLDLNMPRMNGIEFLRELRADKVLTKTVVFVLTTSKAEEDMAMAYERHIAGYMTKSAVDRDFMTAVGLLEHYWRIVELPQPCE
ncbi:MULTISPECIES: response regulator [unclassified Herbaspirillum]|uniref:response regulator n=1 Tax=unclassified Herbaspirillum TaxID=2624150 RepID=UPI000C0BA2F7|nr:MULTISPECIES: response regulator [unclassified Herbaspirillum]MAF00902.1 two-component system response regulator [Herbaspirillum sp.]MBO14812.1 two-component system response regulator [Herbaspirillum sp.]|tara:strand:- start:1823 stop:2260 length:438 start_codon:yes stop_codon:yes gene_type:complete